jgi:hypothetical protein
MVHCRKVRARRAILWSRVRQYEAPRCDCRVTPDHERIAEPAAEFPRNFMAPANKLSAPLISDDDKIRINIKEQ